MNSCMRRDDVAHSVVLEANHRVGNLDKPGKRLSRLGVTPFALKREWKSNKGDHKRASFAGQLRDVWRGTRPGAAAEPRTNKNHTRIGPRSWRACDRLCN